MFSLSIFLGFDAGDAGGTDGDAAAYGDDDDDTNVYGDGDDVAIRVACPGVNGYDDAEGKFHYYRPVDHIGETTTISKAATGVLRNIAKWPNINNFYFYVR